MLDWCSCPTGIWFDYCADWSHQVDVNWHTVACDCACYSCWMQISDVCRQLRWQKYEHRQISVAENQTCGKTCCVILKLRFIITSKSSTSFSRIDILMFFLCVYCAVILSLVCCPVCEEKFSMIFGWQFLSWVDISQKNANKNNERTVVWRWINFHSPKSSKCSTGNSRKCLKPKCYGQHIIG